MKTWNEFYTEQQINENILNGLMAKIGSFIPGITPQEKVDTTLDTLNLALDGVGIADPTGAADGVNSLIYGIRGLATKDPDKRKSHFYNALISAISAVPFGDLAKLLKAKKLLKKPVIQGMQTLRAGARGVRTDRFNTGVADAI